MTPKSTPSLISGRAVRAAAMLCSLVLCVPLRAKGQQQSVPALSPIERKIRDYVRAHEQEQVAFLEKAVNISSGTFNLAGVRSVGRLFEPEFTAIGFDASW